MCIEQRIAKQQNDNKRKAKYEMRNFCGQYGILPMAASQRKHIKRKKEEYDKQRRFWRKEKIFNQMNTIIKIKDFLRNLINIIKNMITRNLIKRKQNVLNVENMVILLMTAKLNKRLTNFK